MNRLKSPVVLGVIGGVVLTQLQQLADMQSITYFDVAIAIVTVFIAGFGAMNNPTDKNNF